MRPISLPADDFVISVWIAANLENLEGYFPIWDAMLISANRSPVAHGGYEINFARYLKSLYTLNEALGGEPNGIKESIQIFTYYKENIWNRRDEKPSIS